MDKVEQLLPILAPRWVGFLGLLLALGLTVWLLVRRQRRQSWSLPLIVSSAGLALAGIGVIFVPTWIGMLLLGTAVVVFFVQLLWLILSSQWWPPLAIATAALAAVGLGGWAGIPTGDALVQVGKT